MTTPTQRTLGALKKLYGQNHVAVVEKWLPRAMVRKDLFGIIDIIALDFTRGVVGVQSTGQDFSGHMRKLTVEKRQESIDWLRTPGACLELWGWRKLKKKRGGRAMVWTPRIKVFSLADFINPFDMNPKQEHKK